MVRVEELSCGLRCMQGLWVMMTPTIFVVGGAISLGLGTRVI